MFASRTRKEWELYVHRPSSQLQIFSSVLEHGRPGTGLTGVRALMMNGQRVTGKPQKVCEVQRVRILERGLKPFQRQNEGTSILEWNGLLKSFKSPFPTPDEM